MEDGEHVPPYYRDQMLLLMEVLDLEHAYYMEWKPETTWTAEQLGVTVVHRDREWFARSLPALRRFYDEMIELRALPGPRLREIFPTATKRPTAVRPFRTSRIVKGFCFRSRDPIPVATGGPDVFYDADELARLVTEKEVALALEEISSEERPPPPETDDDDPIQED